MAKATYRVVEPIRHDGDDLPVGAEVALDKDAAQPLLDAGALAPVEKPAKGA